MGRWGTLTWGAILAFVSVTVPVAAVHAAGGAHVIDDSEVEQPGHCHLESWVSSYDHSGWLANLLPACTPYSPGWLELDSMIAHAWEKQSSSTLVGFGPKITIRPESRGLGIGFSAFVALDTGKDRLETAIFNLPISIPVNKTLHLNVNVGGDWSQTLHRWTMATGLQAEVTLRPDMEIMGEALVRAGEQDGFQVGPRWTVDQGRMDIDLLVAHYADGLSARAITVGVTMRR